MNKSAIKVSQDHLDQGADNLLLECLNVQLGETCLIVVELDESLYEQIVVDTITNRCIHYGVNVTILKQPLVTRVEDFPQSVLTQMRQVEHTVFLSRLGDYLRFSGVPATCSLTTCYAYSATLLASHYARLSHRLMTTLRDSLEADLMNAQQWRVTCPLGTDIAGEFDWASRRGDRDDDFAINLFPISTFKPVACKAATGTVALSRWVMPGGAPKVDNPNLHFDGIVNAAVINGEIDRFYGNALASQQMIDYYDRVSSSLHISRNHVHSWHIGINPHTSFEGSPNKDLERWCAVSFGSPRYLHFHTMGDEPPGEAAWSLFNCTVEIDDEIVWQDGQFVWLTRPEIKQILDQHEDGATLTQTSCNIGVG